MSSTDLSIIACGTLKAEMIFVPGGVDSILERIFAEARSAPKDISTPAGRDAIKSLAYKVARSKTALDEMGKTLVADIKAQSAKIDVERKRIRDQLDALKDEVRKPLTDWEDAEKARIDGHEAAINEIYDLAGLPLSDESLAEVDSRLSDLLGFCFRDWQEFAARGEKAIAEAKAELTRMHAAAVKRDADRAELARLRAEEAKREAERAEEARQQAERERKEREAKIAAQAAEAARIEAEARIARAAALAKAEAERAFERARIEAEKRAEAEAMRVAALEAEKFRLERDKAAAERGRIEAEKAAAEARAEKAERDAAAAVEAERKLVADIAAAEQAGKAKREADLKHRGKTHRDAVGALVAEAGLSVEAAKAAVTAIAQGKVPCIKVVY